MNHKVEVYDIMACTRCFEGTHKKIKTLRHITCCAERLQTTSMSDM